MEDSICLHGGKNGCTLKDILDVDRGEVCICLQGGKNGCTLKDILDVDRGEVSQPEQFNKYSNTPGPHTPPYTHTQTQ